MKKLPLLIACAAVLALGACSSMGFAPATTDAIGKAVAEKIPYCSGDIQIDAGIGGIAGTGTGIKNSGQLHCPGKPYESSGPTAPGTVVAPTPPVTAAPAPPPAPSTQP